MKLWKDHKHAVVNIPDAKKGEQIILLTEHGAATRDELVRYFRAEKIAELAIPKKIITVALLPVLGTGKADYQKAKAIALAEIPALEIMTATPAG
jgi:acyl-[acyl-carrier-protein]-phospholipid O-acyltransferase/long-chain-fatty-acid--[acyl-carrier-protein] ligase